MRRSGVRSSSAPPNILVLSLGCLEMPKSHLPPLVKEIASDGVVWKRLGEVDYETLGYFLSCHLIIEHYID